MWLCGELAWQQLGNPAAFSPTPSALVAFIHTRRHHAASASAYTAPSRSVADAMPARTLAFCLLAMSLPVVSGLGTASVGLYAWQRALAGASAYCAATLVSSPVDVLKCRMQAKQKSSTAVSSKKGLLPLALSMLRTEGPLAFFSGIGPAMLMAPAAMAQYTLIDPLRSYAGLFVAALIAGSIDIIIKCPFERIKTQMQAHGEEAQSIAASLRGTFMAGGVQGLWAGLGVTLARDLPYLVLKWLTYSRAKEILASVVPNADAANLLAGAVAGAVAATAVTPFDVIKTRLQTTESGESNVLSVGRELLAEGGLWALFRGLGPRLLRIPIYTALTLATFDFVKDLFQTLNLNGHDFTLADALAPKREL